MTKALTIVLDGALIGLACVGVFAIGMHNHWPLWAVYGTEFIIAVVGGIRTKS